MQIVTDWRELQSFIKENTPFYQALFNFIFQGVEEPTEENYREHWMHSALIILDSLQDKAGKGEAPRVIAAGGLGQTAGVFICFFQYFAAIFQSSQSFQKLRRLGQFSA